jgi:hypothetical protein
MSRAIYFFADPSDTKALTEYAQSLGLSVVPMRLVPAEIEASRIRPQDHPVCYLSPIPVDALHPYGSPPVNLSGATDPLLEYWRSRVAGSTLVQGRLYWSDDAMEFASVTKPFFSKLQRWIRKNWQRRKEDGYYIGPGAGLAVAEGKYMLSYLDPGAEIVSVPVGGDSQ